MFCEGNRWRVVIAALLILPMASPLLAAEPAPSEGIRDARLRYLLRGLAGPSWTDVGAGVSTSVTFNLQGGLRLTDEFAVAIGYETGLARYSWTSLWGQRYFPFVRADYAPFGALSPYLAIALGPLFVSNEYVFSGSAPNNLNTGTYFSAQPVLGFRAEVGSRLSVLLEAYLHQGLFGTDSFGRGLPLRWGCMAGVSVYL